ncbi:BatD family protein [Oceanomicrobium pacificus]|uniref:Oxygen tolerance n=1 Tax=Oceanomicrobium pacificus TaxID=2692916 RepID=A0A6B0U2P7_9RHOB|nr:BatD family protein [Oceanomicrobium pacificus]MXU65271.1 hypothetical protein [Oceanomicrobium pacificus]
MSGGLCIRGAVSACAVLLAGAAWAADPVVEVVAPEGPLTVGTPATLRITVLSDSFFPAPPVFPEFDEPNLVVTLPPNASGPTSKRIDGETWSGIARRYSVTALAPGDVTLQGTDLQVTVGDGPNAAPRTVAVPMPPVDLSAIVPDGAAALDPYLAADALTLTESWSVEGESFETGAALTRSVMVEAGNTLSMFLPPLLPPAPNGVAVYPEEPSLSDRPGERGRGPTARREDKATYVFQSPGQVTFPAVTLDWWNADAGQVDTARLPERKINVTGEPLSESTDAPPEPEARRSEALPWMGILLVLSWGGLAALALRFWRRWRASPDGREWAAYRDLRAACGTGDAARIARCLDRWAQAGGASRTEFGAAGKGAADALLALNASRFRPDRPALPGDAGAAIAQSARDWRRTRHRRRTPLPDLSLNPSLPGADTG